MSWLTHFLKSTIGSKWLIALTGTGWVLFLIAHCLGNLQVYAGPDAINGYGAKLREMPAILWTARSLLALGILFHIALAVRLKSLSSGARPVKYVVKRHRRANPAGRAMILSGLTLGAFLAYHLAHYTLFLTNPEYKQLTDLEGRHDVYTMVVHGFSNNGLVALYILAAGLVCAHLAHGIPSLFQTFGLRHPKYTPIFGKAGVGLALLLFVGFAMVPVGVMAGWISVSGGL